MSQPPAASASGLTSPGFSIAERERRYGAVRALMRERGLDCLLMPHHTGEWDNYQADTRYLSCVGGGGAATALIFPLEGEPIAVVREARRIDWWREQQEWVSDIRSPAGFSWGGVFRDALRELKLSSGKIGIVGLKDVLRDAEGTAAHGEVEMLKEAFPRASFTSAIEILNAVRKRKSLEEIEMLRRAHRCADAMSVALRKIVREGASEHEIYAEVIAAHIRSGGETPTMVLFGADPRMWQTHLLPRLRRLQPGDVVVLEAEVKYFGYMVQAIETVPLRDLTDTEKQLFEISQACFDVVMAAMKPGVAYADLIALWDKTAEGSQSMAGRTMGHGLGLGQDGPLTTRGGNAGGAVVEAGDCFVLKPWVEDRSGSISVRVGANVIVDTDGASLLKPADEPLRPRAAEAQEQHAGVTP